MSPSKKIAINFSINLSKLKGVRPVYDFIPKSDLHSFGSSFESHILWVTLYITLKHVLKISVL